ncbi:MAG: hypothetical protein WCJ70_04595 [bacterium]
MNTHNTLKTSDIFLATTLSLFYPLDSLDKTNPSRTEFIFKSDDKQHELIESYWQKKLAIEPQALFTQLKYLKSRIYSDR